RGDGDGGDVVRLWRWWRGCGGVGGGYRCVEESGVVDRVHRRMGSLFGLRRICPSEKFSGGGEWWPAAGELAGEDEWEREIWRCI
ncbi:hypothetical protein Tco_0476767, partial [Tanacetum coccineum]